VDLKELADEINSALTLLVLVKPAVYGIDRYGFFFGFASFPKGGGPGTVSKVHLKTA